MDLPQLAGMTPEHARAMLDDTLLLSRWCDDNGVRFGPPIFKALDELAEKTYEDEARAKAEARNSRANRRRRRDLDRIIDTMDRAATRLPRRIENVYCLCIERGLSIDAAAAQLGISRNTVRTHLRRLRAFVHSRRVPESRFEM
jgi:DNA-directed RNA polymerase specialized sigma24 family protein